jgi:2-polyprenyl-3-methyl-5-hydroxy-6-metoxy-1,4-benzoquinol methylase
MVLQQKWIDTVSPLPFAYYSNARTEIVPFLPPNPSRILEVGCGAGATLGYLKQQNLCQWAAGVEIMPDAAAVARQAADVVWQESIETFTLPIEPQSLDVILCMDVLEHLVDPWAVMQKLTPLLAKNGVIIASIPNIILW